MDCDRCGKKCSYEKMPSEHLHYACYKCPDHGIIKWVRKPKNKEKRVDKNQDHRKGHKENGGFVCGICGVDDDLIEESSKWHCDHIIPLNKGGVDEFKNTMMLCKYCHVIKNELQNKIDFLARNKTQ